MPLPEENVIICHGDDDIAISQYIQMLEHELGDGAMGDVNITKMDGRTSSENDLVNIVRSTPFFSEKRLVILSNPLTKMGRGKRDDAEESESGSSEGSVGDTKKRFISLLDVLPGSTALVLIVEDSLSWDSKTKGKSWEVLKGSHFLMKWASQNPGKVLIKPFPLPDPRDMPDWIIKEAAGKNCRIKPDAAAELAQYVGNDTRLAALEIEKLSIYVEGTRPVEMEDVMALSTSTSSATIWNLVDAIGQKNPHRAMLLFHQLLETKDVQFEIFPMIIRQFRLLLMAREVLDDRGDEGMITRELGVAPYVARNLNKQAASFSMPKLEKIYYQLMKIEEDSKSGGGDLEVAIDSLIVSAAG
jgi:DNA polymerase-3 subunit delta